MMRSQPDFAELLRQFCAGSNEAFQELVDQFGSHIYRAVRRRLRGRLRSQFDSADFVQAAWASFLDMRGNLHLQQFTCADDLVAYLARIAENKVVDECRKQMRSDWYNLLREQSLERTGPLAASASKSPTPSAVAIASEQQALLLEDPRATHLHIIEMRTQGASLVEIAEKLGIAEKSVQRALRRMERRVTQ